VAQAAAIFAGTVFTSTTATYSTLSPSTQDWIAIELNVTAMTGTSPQAVFSIQWSDDGGTWADAEPADQFDPITGPCTIAKRFDVKAAYWRAAVVVTGTNSPSFTGSANAYY
jgi:hypothetical protein